MSAPDQPKGGDVLLFPLPDDPAARRAEVNRALEQVGEDELLAILLRQLVETFPSFDEAPSRIKAARDRLMRLVNAAPDTLSALIDLEHEAFNLPDTEWLGPEHPFEVARRKAQRAIAKTEDPSKEPKP